MSTHSKLNHNVLLQAWAQLSVYDKTATELKQNSIKRRKTVVVLTVAATIAAVLASQIEIVELSTVLGIISIVFPILGSYLMNDIAKFTGTTDWIKYRYTSEMMRMHIYLYRMLAGKYGEQPPEKADNLLSEDLAKVRNSVNWDGVIPPSITEPVEETDIKAIIKQANHYVQADDGLSNIDVKDYIKWRVDAQRAWYDRKVKDDFKRMKTFFRASQGALLVGSIVGALAGFFAIEFVIMIAITNAISVAITSWSNVSMYGTTYAIFMITSQKLGDLKRDWSAIENDSEMKEQGKREIEIANFVQRVENVLLWERQEWYELVLQAQALGDKVIMEDLQRLAKRADKETELTYTADVD